MSQDIIVFSTVDKQSPGVYSVDYQVHDGAYNWADPVTRIVQVRDSMLPVVTQRPIPPLTPADGTLRNFSLSQCLDVQDRCDGSMDPNFHCLITSISSDEPWRTQVTSSMTATAPSGCARRPTPAAMAVSTP